MWNRHDWFKIYSTVGFFVFENRFESHCMLGYPTWGIRRPVISVLVAKTIKLQTSKNDVPHKAQFTGSLQDFSTAEVSSAPLPGAATRGHYSPSLLPVTDAGWSPALLRPCTQPVARNQSVVSAARHLSRPHAFVSFSWRMKKGNIYFSSCPGCIKLLQTLEQNRTGCAYLQGHIAYL